MAVTPVNSTITVVTSGTEIQCTSDTNIRPTSVYFEAFATNTNPIFIGLSTVSTTVYIARLEAGQGFLLSVDGAGGLNYRAGTQGLQLSALYVDATTNGEKCQMTYMYATGG
jgi:hypothetical protein